MATFLSLIQTLSLAAVAAAFVLIGVAAYRFLSKVETQGLLLRVLHERDGISSRSPHPPEAGYAVYVWTGGGWTLETDFSRPGFETTPPTRPGSYEGQAIKKEAVPR